MRLRLALLFLLLHSSFLISEAQAPKTYSSSEILLGLQKLNVLGSVLYIAAHPDDENTRLLAYLANERKVETAYLSLTRGDGGQNLIGPELGPALGLIRTQELLAARRIDGASQFFTRANDFGFSKTAQETFTLWNREQVLADVVWVIRQRRPDVLITRFPPDARAGHGHHQASAILAAEAFDAAGDSCRFPEQLKYVPTWQPKRLLWNTGSFFVKPGEDMSGYLKMDTGGYNPLLGKSYGELAALSRSQHRSQGMGTAAQRGESMEYFQLVKGAPATKDIFDGVDLTWNRIERGEKVGAAVAEVIRKFDAANPAASVAGLAKTAASIGSIFSRSGYADSVSLAIFYLLLKKQANGELMASCLGLSAEATVAQASVHPGEEVSLKVELVNRSRRSLQLTGSSCTAGFRCDSSIRKTLLPGQASTTLLKAVAAPTILTTQPYWLRQAATTGMYVVPDSIALDYGFRPTVPKQVVIGTAEGLLPPTLPYGIAVDGQELGLWVPIRHKHTDPVLGELYQPVAVVPPVMVNLPAAHAYVFADARPRTVPVTLRAGRAGVAGSLALALPPGWQCVPAAAPFDLKAKDEELTLTFRVQPLPAAAAGHTELRAIATLNDNPQAPPLPQGRGPGGGAGYSRGIQTIAYLHIPTQTLFPEAVAPLVKLDVKRGKTQTVGYLMGAGDEVPEALRQLGYTLTLLDPTTDLTADKLARFDAVVLGIRAYNTVERLKTQQPELLKYVENGGNLVVQYTVTRGTVLPQIGPYPLTLSNDRVTVETAPVSFLAPAHPLLNTPNKLTPADFTGWVQEQGLYYPSAWDVKYTPLIASHDPGEEDKKSAILVADYGKGHYIYTGLSFFRELPAGVPGAYRILANLVSYGR